MSREIRTHNDDSDWEFERMMKIKNHRCIQVADEQAESYVDYHELIEKVDQEELNGEFLVDYIIKNSFPPMKTWV